MKTFTPSSAGAWTDYDIYTNLSIPKGAVCEIFCANGNTSSNMLMGLRTDGSSVSRSYYEHESEGNDFSGFLLHVKVDSSTGYIEYYASSTTAGDVTFFVLGYWEGVDYTEQTSANIVGTADSTWRDYDASGIGADTVLSVLICNANSSSAATVGVRTNGSSLERKIALHESEPSASYPKNDGPLFVKTDGSGYIEYYSSSSLARAFITGYFGSTLDFTELWSQKTISSGSTWEDNDLTSEIGADGNIVAMYCGHNQTGAAVNLGCRKNGSSVSRYIALHEAETNGYNGYGASVQTDTSGIIEIYSSDATHEYFWLQGYFEEVASGTTYNNTRSETLTLTETRTRVWTHQPTRSETIKLAETRARSWTAVRERLETLEISESLASLRVLAREFLETVALSESRTRAWTAIRERLDSVALAESRTRAWAATRVRVETIALTESLARGLSKTLEEIIELGESLTNELIHTGTVYSETFEEILTLAESRVRVLISSRTLTETIELVESRAREWIIARVLTETVLLAESKTRELAREFAEAVAIAESTVIALGSAPVTLIRLVLRMMTQSLEVTMSKKEEKVKLKPEGG